MEGATSRSFARTSLSKYVQHLNDEEMTRFLSKYSMIGVQDPYNLPDGLLKLLRDIQIPAEVPDIAYHYVYNYLVHTQSYYTRQSLKAYKSLEAYKYLVAGWVSGLQLWKGPNKSLYLTNAKVAHSKLLSKQAL